MMTPNVKADVDSNGMKIFTQLPNYGRPENLKEAGLDCLGFIEQIDFETNSVQTNSIDFIFN